MTSPDAESFDRWYRAIGASTRWDPFMREWLELPPDVQSNGYLTGSGLSEVLDRLRLTPQSALVELGCGRGGYGMAAARASGARLVGIDFSDAALTAARHQAARLHLDDVVEFRAGDLTSTGLLADSADAVLCIDAFHFARPPSAAAAEFRRLLRPEGRLVLTSWEPVEPGDPVLPERLRQLDVSQELSTAGFVDIDRELRTDWSILERALWEAAVRLDPAGDPAIADLVEEASELLRVATSLRRVLVTARAPAATPADPPSVPLGSVGKKVHRDAGPLSQRLSRSTLYAPYASRTLWTVRWSFAKVDDRHFCFRPSRKPRSSHTSKLTIVLSEKLLPRTLSVISDT